MENVAAAYRVDAVAVKNGERWLFTTAKYTTVTSW